MTVNVEVSRQGTENNLSLLRRFTKRVQGSGVLLRVRRGRYSARNISENVKRKHTLKLLKKREVVAEAIKMGKFVPNVRGRRR